MSKQELMEELADKLTAQDLYQLQEKVYKSGRERFRKKISEQLDSASDIFDKMTLEGAYAKTFKIDSRMTLTLRTMLQEFEEKCSEFVTNNRVNNDQAGHIFRRRRLSYCLLAVNNNNFGVTPTPINVHDMLAVDQKDKYDIFHNKADQRYELLGMQSSMVVSRYSEIFSAFELEVEARLKEDDLLPLDSGDHSDQS